MTRLLTRIRPRSLRSPWIQLPNRARVQFTIVLPASDERLATGSEVETLRARHLTRVS